MKETSGGCAWQQLHFSQSLGLGPLGFGSPASQGISSLAKLLEHRNVFGGVCSVAVFEFPNSSSSCGSSSCGRCCLLCRVECCVVCVWRVTGRKCRRRRSHVVWRRRSGLCRRAEVESSEAAERVGCVTSAAAVATVAESRRLRGTVRQRIMSVECGGSTPEQQLST